MSTGWENLESSPIEFMHSELLNEFHSWRLKQTTNTSININGKEFNDIVVNAKKATYKKYKSMELDKPIEKNKL